MNDATFFKDCVTTIPPHGLIFIVAGIRRHRLRACVDNNFPISPAVTHVRKGGAITALFVRSILRK